MIRAFGEWHVVRDARRRATRGRYTLDTHDIDLQDTTQSDLDRWLIDHRSPHRTIVTFIHWAVARRLTGKLTISRPSKKSDSGFLDEQDLQEQLRRCLNDDTLPQEARIIGALIRLYALPVSRIVELITDRFHRDETGAYLTLDRHPVLLPSKLAALIEEQIAQPVADSRMRQQFGNGNGYLFPGKAPGRPRNVIGTQPVEPARTARPLRPQHRHDRSRHQSPAHRGRRPLRHASQHGPEMGELCQRRLERLPRDPHDHRLMERVGTDRLACAPSWTRTP
ncbi:hypothetical protein ABZ614_34920 [Streptomyces sp. NPDC013178]|uniref:hypothetical protein n=1 Tax=Streptomyces sp. NPDC013178 TaxID=3155118 RepID=UPI0033D85AD4